MSAPTENQEWDWITLQNEFSGLCESDARELAEQIAEIQQPLVDALTKISNAQTCTVYQQDSVMRVDKFTAYLASNTVDVAKAALAKVKK